MGFVTVDVVIDGCVVCVIDDVNCVAPEIRFKLKLDGLNIQEAIPTIEIPKPFLQYEPMVECFSGEEAEIGLLDVVFCRIGLAVVVLVN